MISRPLSSGRPAVVVVDRAPHIYALHVPGTPGDGVVGWVLALPNGNVLEIDHSGEVTAASTLERAEARCARHGTQLMEVVELPRELSAA